MNNSKAKLSEASQENKQANKKFGSKRASIDMSNNLDLEKDLIPKTQHMKQNSETNEKVNNSKDTYSKFNQNLNKNKIFLNTGFLNKSFKQKDHFTRRFSHAHPTSKTARRINFNKIFK